MKHYHYSTTISALCCICFSLLTGGGLPSTTTMMAEAFAPKSLVARCNARCLGDVDIVEAATSIRSSSSSGSSSSSSTSLSMAQNNEDLLRWARASRSAGSEDNVVELLRPLGLVLNADESGNVYVETVAPKGNAARTGKVKEGDIVTMCSATFGNEMWSTRGVGLSRVLAAIRVRAGPTVKLVFESPDQYKKKAAMTTAQRKAQEDARAAAQAKKDRLLSELEEDEKKLKKGKLFGLF